MSIVVDQTLRTAIKALMAKAAQEGYVDPEQQIVADLTMPRSEWEKRRVAIGPYLVAYTHDQLMPQVRAKHVSITGPHPPAEDCVAILREFGFGGPLGRYYRLEVDSTVHFMDLPPAIIEMLRTRASTQACH